MVKTSKSKRGQNPPTKRPPTEKLTAKAGPPVKKRISKKDSIIALLQQPQGTTIKAMMKATGWQSHSVRGFLAGTVAKKMKLKLQSEKIGSERVYRLGRSSKAAAATQPERQG
jgi:hypothetical protein